MPPRTDEHRAFGLKIAEAVRCIPWTERPDAVVPESCLAYADWLREEQRWPGAADLVGGIEKLQDMQFMPGGRGSLFALDVYDAMPSRPPAIDLIVDPAIRPCRLTYTVNLLVKGQRRFRLNPSANRAPGLVRWVRNFCPDEAFEIVRGMPGCPGALKTLREIEAYARDRTRNRRS
jgi:hypothetical protein